MSQYYGYSSNFSRQPQQIQQQPQQRQQQSQQQTQKQKKKNNSPQQTGNQRRTAMIFFVIFLILFLILFGLVIWFFFFRSYLKPFERVCQSNSNCLPNEYCNEGICNAVLCKNNSDCSKTANGNGTCIAGYCETSLCNQNLECSRLYNDTNFVCSKFDATIITSWIDSACVKAGGECKSDNDCYGGSFGLVCSDSGVCVQCNSDVDCDTGLYCKAGVCSNCDSTPCTDGPCASDCPTGVCTGSGTCCAGDLVYNVNGTTSCQKGKTFDHCLKDEDCESSNCHDLGGVKVCGFSTQDDCLFTAGTIADESVTGSTKDKFNSMVCAAPEGVYDSKSAPFCAKGKCSNLSVGSACYVPPYCVNPANRQNLLCSGKVTFTNPYQPGCKTDSDCSSGNVCFSGICSEKCTTTDDCQVGYMCTENKTTKVKACTYPQTNPICTSDSDCQNSYSCNFDSRGAATGNCTYTTSANQSPPPPPVFLNICSIAPSTLTTANANGLVASYCTDGYCQNYSGWIGQICNTDNDCSLLTTDEKAGRISLVCDTTPIGGSQSVRMCKTG